MIEIKFGDCVDLLKEIEDESVDLIVTNPPYGIGYKTSWRIEKAHRFTSEIANDKDLSILEIVAPELHRVLKNDSACFVFCSWNKQAEVNEILTGGGRFSMKNLIVWDKCNTTAGDLTHAFGHQYEFMVFATKGNPVIRGKRHSDLWRYPRVSADKLLHQNEKPVSLLERAILAMSDEGALVLDPFMGSGSTGIACLWTHRDFIGMEIDQGYFDVASKRLDAEQRQGRLF